MAESPRPPQTEPPPQPTEGGWRKRIVQIVIWVAVLAVFGLAFYLVSGHKPNPASQQGGGGHRGQGGPVTVTAVAAKKGDIGVYLEEIGTVTPVHTASIVNQVTGNVVAVNYHEGQLVKEGDPLVDLDSRQYEATLLQAQGTLEKDQATLAKDQIDLQRYQEAWKRNAISKQMLDDQTKLVTQDEGQVKNDQGLVKYDQVQVDYCHIKAPFTGRVGLRLVDPGNLVTAGSSATPLVVVTQLQPITVVFTVAEDDLGGVQEQLAKGEKLRVDVSDRSRQTHLATGELTALDNQIDTTTGTLKLRATFANDDLQLFPNQFVNVRLLVQTLHDVTLIPKAAIQQNGQTSFVYVVQDGVVHQRNVKPGAEDGGMAQVDGINPGDQIADSSFDKLQDNDHVNLNDGSHEGGKPPGGSPGPNGGQSPANRQGKHRQGGGGNGGGGS